MRADRSPWVRALAGALAIVIALTLSAAPLAADETATAAPQPQATTLAAAAAKLASLDPAPRAFAAAQEPLAAPGTDSKSFFKSRKGAIVLVLLAGGIGWTIYSNSHDRITSPIR